MRLDLPRVTVFVLLTAVGCAQKTDSNSGGALAQQQGQRTEQNAKATPDQIRSEVLSFADTLILTTAQALEEMERQTQRPEVAAWASRYKINTAEAALTTSTSPNPMISLLDTIVLVTLKRMLLEEHWVPTLLHEEGKGVLDSFRHAEADAWAMADRVLTPSQLTELRGLIEKWRKENPTQYVTNHVRFADFSDARHAYDRAGKPPAPGSLLSLLMIDPMTKMDPVARELRGYRLLTERMFFMAKRMPAIMSWEIQASIREASENRQAQRFLDSLNTFNNHLKTFNDTTTGFSATLREYPKDLARERELLIQEFLDGITVQRKAMFEGLTAQHQALDRSISVQRQGLTKDIEAEHDRLTALLADARTTLKEVRDTSASLKSSAGDTVALAEESSGRLAQKIFNYLLVLLLVLLIVGPIMLLIYRYAASRITAGASRPPSSAPADEPETALTH